MGDKPFPGFPWFSYQPPKEDRMYNELYLRIEKLEERVAELEKLSELQTEILRLLNDTNRSRT